MIAGVAREVTGKGPARLVHAPVHGRAPLVPFLRASSPGCTVSGGVFSSRTSHPGWKTPRPHAFVSYLGPWGGPPTRVLPVGMDDDRLCAWESRLSLHVVQYILCAAGHAGQSCFPRRLVDEGTVCYVGTGRQLAVSCMASITARGESLLYSGIFDEPKGGKQAAQDRWEKHLTVSTVRGEQCWNRAGLLNRIWLRLCSCDRPVPPRPRTSQRLGLSHHMGDEWREAVSSLGCSCCPTKPGWRFFQNTLFACIGISIF